MDCLETTFFILYNCTYGVFTEFISVLNTINILVKANFMKLSCFKLKFVHILYCINRMYIHKNASDLDTFESVRRKANIVPKPFRV